MWTITILVLILPIYIAPLIYNSTSSEINTIFSITVPLGFFLGVAIGGNDICNAMGTSVGCKTLTIKQAIIIGIFFEMAGALLMGS